LQTFSAPRGARISRLASQRGSVFMVYAPKQLNEKKPGQRRAVLE
jgi:hypothetical protein